MIRKKSKLRLNDELIPKPPNVNIAEKMTKVVTPKEHPYSSHISRVALFPSFSSPDDQETGVRAASKNFRNRFVPNRPSNVIVLSKTIGSPYRHEIIGKPEKTMTSAVLLTGDDGFVDKTKSSGENQVFYPTPQKAIVPNPKLRSWDLTLSERTSNMLKNLERSIWKSSYQMHYAGFGLSNSMGIDDFHHKIVKLAGRNLHSADMAREGSNSVFLPSKKQERSEMRQDTEEEGSTSGITAAELQNTYSTPNQRTISTITNQHKLQAMRHSNQAPTSNQVSFSQPEKKVYSLGEQHTELSPQTSRKQQAQNERKQRENAKVHFDETIMTKSKSKSGKEAATDQISNLKSSLNLNNQPCLHTNVSGESRTLDAKDLLTSKKDENQAVSRTRTNTERHAGITSEQDRKEHHHVSSHSSILPQPPVLPGILSMGRRGCVTGASKTLSLLELQQTFSKSEAHRNFNNSITYAAVDPRDNVCSGKKHNFFGINCNYIHG